MADASLLAVGHVSLDTSLGGETYKRDQSKAGQAGSGMARNSGSDLYLRCSLSDGFRWRTALETLDPTRIHKTVKIALQ